MENILKLTVKRDVFDNLASGKQSYVYVEGNGYWIRRLATNSSDSFDKLKETQDFRTFDTVSVTCVKDNAIYPFKKIRTGSNYEGDNDAEDDGFKIWLEMNEYHNVGEETESENVNEPNDEPNDEPNEDEEYEGDDEICDEIDEVADDEGNLTTDLSEVEKEDDVEDKDEYITNSVSFILDVICNYNNVKMVKSPLVILTSNGRIFGTNDRININNDVEIRIPIGFEKIYDDTNNNDEFIEKIEKFLCEYCSKGHVFIYANGCRLIHNDNERYYMFRIAKRVY